MSTTATIAATSRIIVDDGEDTLGVDHSRFDHYFLLDEIDLTPLTFVGENFTFQGAEGCLDHFSLEASSGLNGSDISVTFNERGREDTVYMSPVQLRKLIGKLQFCTEYTHEGREYFDFVEAASVTFEQIFRAARDEGDLEAVLERFDFTKRPEGGYPLRD